MKEPGPTVFNEAQLLMAVSLLPGRAEASNTLLGRGSSTDARGVVTKTFTLGRRAHVDGEKTMDRHDFGRISLRESDHVITRRIALFDSEGHVATEIVCARNKETTDVSIGATSFDPASGLATVFAPDSLEAMKLAHEALAVVWQGTKVQEPDLTKEV